MGNTILKKLNEKVIAEREKAYLQCKQKVLYELKHTNDLKVCEKVSSKNQTFNTNIEELKEEEEEVVVVEANNHSNPRKETDIHNLVMERLPKEYVYAYRQESLYAGTPIYKKRYAWIVLLLISFALFGLYSSWKNAVVSFSTFFLTTVIMLYVADFQTGILHIILDNRKSFQYPVLSQPCLEFMWHHIIPHDLGDRYIVDIWGDLNVIFVIVVGIMTGMRYYFKDPLFELLRSLQILSIYFAIYCHHLSHSRAKYTDFLTKYLHGHHKIHHIAPHNQNYCLIGIGDYLVAPMAKYIPELFGENISYIFFVILMLGLMLFHPLIASLIYSFENRII